MILWALGFSIALAQPTPFPNATSGGGGYPGLGGGVGGVFGGGGYTGGLIGGSGPSGPFGINPQSDFGASSGKSPGSSLNSKAYVADTVSCPFRRDKADNAASLLAGVNNALSDLSGKCSSLSTSLGNLQDSTRNLNSLNQGMNGGLQNGSVTVTCANYEHALRQEFDFISANPTIRASKSQNYGTCAFQQGSLLTECLESAYVEALSTFHFNCKDQFEEQAMNTVKQSLNGLVSQMNTLINQSSSCDKDPEVQKSIILASINTIAAVSAMAPAAGLSGTAIDLSGRVINNLVEKYFSSKGPANAIQVLLREDESENLACLWYSLQNRTLNCVAQEAEKNLPKEIKVTTCPGSKIPGLPLMTGKSLAELKQVLTESLDNRTSEAVASLLNTEFDSSNGKPPQSVEKALDDISKTLQASGNSERKALGLKVENLLSNLKTSAIPFGAFKSPTDKTVPAETLNWNEITTAYLDEVGTDNGIRKLQASEEIKQAIDAGYKIAMESREHLLSGDDYQRSLNIASSYMVSNFQNVFLERLEKLNKTYELNKAFQTNSKNLGDLKPIYTLCSQAASMFYVGKVGNAEIERSFNNVRAPSPIFTKACSKFNCTNEPKVMSPFPVSEFGETKRPQELSSYQCNQVSKYNQGLDLLKKNVEKTGLACPN
jgi:hypothetical protein